MRMNSIKKAVLLFVVLALSQISVNAKTFSDIPNDFWAYNAIDYLTDIGLINGYEDNTFRPEKNVTRAEYATLIVRAIGMDKIPIETMY